MKRIWSKGHIFVWHPTDTGISPETSRVKKVVKSILETWNVNDVIVMFILLIFG